MQAPAWDHVLYSPCREVPALTPCFVPVTQPPLPLPGTLFPARQHLSVGGRPRQLPALAARPVAISLEVSMRSSSLSPPSPHLSVRRVGRPPRGPLPTLPLAPPLLVALSPVAAERQPAVPRRSSPRRRRRTEKAGPTAAVAVRAVVAANEEMSEPSPAGAGVSGATVAFVEGAQAESPASPPAASAAMPVAVREVAAHLSTAPTRRRRRSRRRRPNGYWSDLAVLQAALAEVSCHPGSDADSRVALAHSDATVRTGGDSSLASPPPPQPQAVMPTRAQLSAAGRVDLLSALAAHGGARRVAGRLGWAMATAPAGTWRGADSDEALQRCLEAFLDAFSPPSARTSTAAAVSDEGNSLSPFSLSSDVTPSQRVMPTRRQLLAAGRSDLVSAIACRGGFTAVARRLGWASVQPRRHWASWPVFRNAVIAAGAAAPDGQWWERGDLAAASRLHGGPAVVAARLSSEGGGWTPPGVATAADADAAPSERPPLIGMSGAGSAAAGTPSRSRRPRRPAGYWRDWKTMEGAVRSFAEAHTGGRMPTQRELRAAQRTDLLGALRAHGGLGHVTSRLALPVARRNRRRRNHWAEPSTLHAELRAYMADVGAYPRLMPRREDLARHSRGDLIYAVERHGGFPAVAASMHLQWHGPASYWRSFTNLRSRLMAHIKATRKRQVASGGAPPTGAATAVAADGTTTTTAAVMPNFQQLHAVGRWDLIYGVALHGGVPEVARRMGLAVVFPPGFASGAGASDPGAIEAELRRFIGIQPRELHRDMPSSCALVRAGRADLAAAVRDTGGWVYYAQRLGLRFVFDRRPKGFWASSANVLRELANYVQAREDGERGGAVEVIREPDAADATEVDRSATTVAGPQAALPSREASTVVLPLGRASRHRHVRLTAIPCVERLKRDGRGDIAFAIQRYHGGEAAFAASTGLVVRSDEAPSPPPPSELLRSWPAFAAALREWMAAHGSLPGVMPSRDELVRTGRHDLRFAVYTHGGREIVAKRIGLVLPGCRGWVGVWLARQTGLLVTDLAAGRRMGGLECTTAVGSRRRAALLERVAGRRAANGGASRPRGRRVGGGGKVAAASAAHRRRGVGRGTPTAGAVRTA